MKAFKDLLFSSLFLSIYRYSSILNSRVSPSRVTLTPFVISTQLIWNVYKEYSGIKSCIMIAFRLMSTALVFFFVKCAFGNFQILVGVKNKSCL